MPKKKNPLPTIPYKKAAKKAANYKDYINMFQLRDVPISDAALEHYAAEVIDWAWEDKEALHLQWFHLNKGFTSGTWSELVRRSPILKEAWEFARAVIGLRRQDQGETGKRDKTMIMFTMPLYSKEWKELEEWHAQVKAKANDDIFIPKTIVELRTMPTTDIVPERHEPRDPDTTK